MIVRMFCCAALIPLWAPVALAEQAKEKSGTATIRVMSFNIWVGGEGGLHPLERTAEAVQESQADIVGVQESMGRERPDGTRPNNAQKVAEMLGWNHIDQGDGKGIITPHVIVGLTPGKHGAEIRLPSGVSLHIFNVHLNHAPYQPYQLLKIDYEDAPFLDTAEELVAAAEAARGAELAGTLAEIAPLLKAGADVVLTGDFNEPSHLDWTPRAVEAGVVPLAVEYPASLAVVKLGLVDAYRRVHPDETANPGFTWTPTTKINDPTDRHDRIDFVYVSPNLEVLACQILGENTEYADITTEVPYPSDHRAVIATIKHK